ncbi:MBL fold metallo-hydrolase [Marinobacter fonticola]|uniref:MBL fold metallo-hydrolase n=1 Tax=Marinobacter fonticola TaxID=2603215 RepID=UPI0011E8280A|nr:rhodanese-like domain-containing protein [Marinobacter fonticola]
MFIERIKSEGLSQLSYLIGGGGKAVVIDPRRDCEVYLEKAAQLGCRITHIFETHRNEDLISGSPVLASLTGAKVYHGPHAAGKVKYADTVAEGDSFSTGEVRIDVLETPGHTDDSVSYVLSDQSYGEEAVAVCTGDALFVGDVGRTDFYPERAEEVAGLLFDSLQKLLTLDDHVYVLPAHGAGSVCGDNMANRDFSSIGYERAHNKMLQITDRKSFIAAKLDEHHYQPPYFRLMERLNLEGGKPAARTLVPMPLDLAEFQELAKHSALVDIRDVTAYLGAHVPGSLALPVGMLASFAGWLLKPEDELTLIAENATQAEAAARHLARIGFDNVQGYFALPMPGWAANGLSFESIPAIGVEDVARRVNEKPDNWQLLDVRSQSEVEGGVIDGSKHIYVGHIPVEMDALSSDKHYTVMCASGARATVAASVLLSKGVKNVDVFMGSMGAWKKAGYSVG